MSRIGSVSRFAAFDLLTTAIVVTHESGRIVWCNGAAEVLLGSSRRNIQGEDISELIPQCREWLRRIAERGERVAPISSIAQLCRPLSDPEPVHATLSRLPGKFDEMVLELAQMQKAFEMQRQEQEAGLSNATKVLLRNLAHEVKNPLGGIRGAAQLLEAELSEGEREYTEVIIGEADRLQTLVDRLLAPYRYERRLGEVNIYEVLERVRNLLLAEFSAGLSIVRDYDVSVPSILGDKEQLIQVFLNLMRNAAQAMKDSIATGAAKITVRTRISRQVAIQQKRYKLALSVHVIDNGPGIDEAIREKIFYPLVTGRSEGTGLGLSLVQTYIEQHAGCIDVTSEPGCTDFGILFPIGKPLAGG